MQLRGFRRFAGSPRQRLETYIFYGTVQIQDVAHATNAKQTDSWGTFVTFETPEGSTTP